MEFFTEENWKTLEHDCGDLETGDAPKKVECQTVKTIEEINQIADQKWEAIRQGFQMF